MKRSRRRWWTRGVSVIAGLLVSTAVLSGLFQLAVLMVPAYRVQLSDWVSDLAGQSVEIGGVGLGWRGLSPQVELTDIVLLEGDAAAFSAQRLQLGFSLPHLLLGEVLPQRIALSGLRVTVHVAADGRLRVAGFDTDASPEEKVSWRHLLSRFPSCRISQAQVQLRWARWPERPLGLSIVDATLTETRNGFDVELDGLLPQSLGGRIQLSAEITGEADRLDEWRGDWRIDATDLQPQGWWPEGWQTDAHIEARQLRAQLAGRFGDGAGLTVDAHIDAEELRGRVGDITVSALDQAQLRARLAWQGGRDWQMQIDEYRAAGERLGNLSLRQAPTGWSMATPFVDLAGVATWMSLREGPMAASLRSLSGKVTELSLQQAAEGGALVGQFTLSDVAMQVADDRLRLAGIGGTVTLSEGGGHFALDGRGGSVALPAVLSSALEVTRLEGEVFWRPAASRGWVIEAPDLHWDVSAARGHGRVEVQWAPGVPPLVKTAQTFEIADVTQLAPYIPRFWHPALQRWLRESIQAGRAEGGTLLIDGPMTDFPFVARPTGRWQLDVPLRGIALRYAPEWPPLDQADADLRVSGMTLSATARDIKSARLSAADAQVRITNLVDPLLVVETRIEGLLPNYYSFIAASPLRAPLRILLDQTSAKGSAAVALELAIPLKRVRDTTVVGSVALRDAELRVDALREPLQSLSGVIHFDEQRVEAEALEADWAGTAVTAQITPRAGTAGVLVASARVAADAVAIEQWMLPTLAPKLRGSARWRLRLPFTDAGADLRLDSELEGLTIDLPPPLGKVAETEASLSLRLQGDAATQQLGFAFADQRLGGQLAWRREPEGLQLMGADLRIGEPLLGVATAPEGLTLQGRLAQADTAEWLPLLGGTSSPSLPLKRIDLWIADLRSGPLRLTDQHLLLAAVREGYAVDLDGAVRGTLRWSPGVRLLSGDIASASLGYEPTSIAFNDAPDGAPYLPNQWPTVRFDIARLAMNGRTLGTARLRATPEEGGYRLDELRLSDGVLAGSVSGIWSRSRSSGRAALDFDLTSGAPDVLLQAFGYTPNIAAESAVISGSLRWPAVATALHWSQAEGSIDLLAQNGTLRAIDPGAGRVLGLINFFAIPRRFLLDFRDLTEEGMRFDRIEGRFDLAEGLARTDHVKIGGPSLRMEIRGEVDLAARTLDHRVKVLPGLSGGVTLGAVLLAGPAAGVLVMLAQELLEKPIDQITQFGYRITGPWDNPEVNRLDARDRLPASGETIP